MNEVKMKIILLISIIVGYIAIHRENPFWLLIEYFKYLYFILNFFSIIHTLIVQLNLEENNNANNV